MKNKLSLLSLLLATVLISQAQTIISPNIDFESEEENHVLRTHKGDQYIGKTIAIRNDTIDFKMRSLPNILHIPLAEVSSLGLTGENLADFNDDQTEGKKKKSFVPMPSNQLLYSSSALPYRGKGLYRNTMLLVNQIEIQPNEHFSFNVGSFIPALISIKLQGQFSINEFIHAGLVLQEHIVLFDEQFITHAYGVFTVGKHEKYLNLGFGYWLDRQNTRFFRPERMRNAPIFSIGGSFSFDNGWRVYTETMVLIDQFDQVVLPSLSFSKYKGRSMFEIGIIAIPDSFIPLLPLLSYNYAF